MPDIDIERTANTARDIAQEAGHLVMRHFGSARTFFKTSSFDIGSVVTNADIESERFIVRKLKEAFPNHEIYGEEEHTRIGDHIFTWYVDPIDGTSNFARGIPLFGISIGLVKSGTPIVGVLNFPALDLLIHASAGHGAYAGKQKLTVSNRPLEQALYFAHGIWEKEMQTHPDIANNSAIVKIIDSSAYELAQIALGNGEIYYLASVPHDVVAGICIVQEAGGKITDGKGNPWTLESTDILVTNGVVHEKVLKFLNKNI